MGDCCLKDHMEMAGLDDNLRPQIRAECIEYWDRMTGNGTTDLKTWENIHILGFKD